MQICQDGCLDLYRFLLPCPITRKKCTKLAWLLVKKNPLQQHITLFVGDCVCVGHVCDIYKNMCKFNVLYIYMHIHAEYKYIYIYIMVHLFFV